MLNEIALHYGDPPASDAGIRGHSHNPTSLNSLVSPEPLQPLRPQHRRSRERVDSLADEVLSLLTSSMTRKGSLKKMRYDETRPLLLAVLRRRIAMGEPVQLTLMAFPFKVPNPAKVGPRAMPDLAELAAIQRFCSLEKMIRAVYEPGLELHILHDGALLSDVFDISVEEVRRYEGYFQGLIRIADACGFIHCHDFTEMQRSGGLDPTRTLTSLRAEANDWWNSTLGAPEWRACFRKTLGMMNLRALPWQIASGLLGEAREGRLPAGFADLERRVHRAMVEYRMKDQIIHRFDPRPICFPDAIHATTQQRPGRLALWLVRRGRGFLPWHGVGVVNCLRQVSVRPAEDVLNRPDIQPMYLGSEPSPFLYLASAAENFAATAS